MKKSRLREWAGRTVAETSFPMMAGEQVTSPEEAAVIANPKGEAIQCQKVSAYRIASLGDLPIVRNNYFPCNRPQADLSVNPA